MMVRLPFPRVITSVRYIGGRSNMFAFLYYAPPSQIIYKFTVFWEQFFTFLICNVMRLVQGSLNLIQYRSVAWLFCCVLFCKLLRAYVLR